jgi:UDP-glucose 4-epimerase
MKILVIGGAGYIGGHVVRELLDQKHTVTVYDNLSSGSKENLFPEASFIKGDILDYVLLKKTMSAGFDGLVHLAALKAAGESMTAVEKYCTNNIVGTINILNGASECAINKFIFSSTAAVYGSPVYLPMDEKHPLNPKNFYGFTKLEIERLLDWYSRIRGINYAALRYFNAAGYDTQDRCTALERDPQNLLPIIMEVAAGMRKNFCIYGNDYDTRDGTGVRDYIHVTDLAKAHVKALDYIEKNKTNLTVNLGSQTGISVMEMVENARRITKQPIEAIISGRRPGDPGTVLATAAYAKLVLGWEAGFSDVETLISSTWKVYKKNIKSSL